MSSEVSIEQRERLQPRLERWAVQIERVGMRGIVDALLGADGPLNLLGAQLIWVAQPVLGLLMPRDDLDTFARLLSDPEGARWLCERLTRIPDGIRDHSIHSAGDDPGSGPV